MGRAACRDKPSDDGFTVVELLLAATLGAILTGMVLLWLFSAQNASDKIAGNLEEESGLALTLELALAELSDARPTALCLDPNPNAQSEPSPTTTTTSIPAPPTTILPCDTAGRGDNWGYWPTVGSGTRLFVPGSPFYEAEADKLCFYALPRGTVADPSTSQTPWGRCLEKSATAARLLARTLEPEAAAKGDDLTAAIASSYDWSSGTWTERTLGRIDTIEFEYQDFDGEAITPPAGSSSLEDGELDDIAVVTVTLTEGVAPDVSRVSGSLAIRANVFSPCRQNTTTAPTCPWLEDPTSLSLDTSTADQIDASWTAPSGNVPTTGYDVEYRADAATSWSDTGHTGTGTTASITGLTTGTKYHVRVRATNSADMSEWLSAEATAT